MTSKYLREFYLDYVNNYLTVEKIAEHNELDPGDATILIQLGKKYHENYVQMMKG